MIFCPRCKVSILKEIGFTIGGFKLKACPNCKGVFCDLKEDSEQNVVDKSKN